MSLPVMTPSPDAVAPLLPPTAELPLPVRRVNFWLALMLFWLLPRRYGPQLAAASLRRAMLAHLLGVVAMLCVVFFTSVVDLGEVDSWYDLRTKVATRILDMAASSRSATFPVVLILGVPLLEVFLLFVAGLLMPWCAGGDSAKSVLARSVKNVYWSTTILLPACVLGLVADPLSRDFWSGLVLCAAIFGLALLLIRSWLVGASRCAGEPRGPAFSPREPRCDSCGYRIVTLPLQSVCPECGLPVRESLVGGRRRGWWSGEHLHPRDFGRFVRMQWRVLCSATPFMHIAVQEGISPGRHFWWGTYLLVVLAVAGAVWGAELLGIDLRTVGVLLVCMPLVLQTIMMSAGCLWAQFAFGIADYRVSAVACYYASPLMWPLVLAMLGYGLGMGGSRRAGVLGPDLRLPAWDPDGWVLLIILAGGLAFWWLRLSRALAAVRYANV